MYVDKDNNGEYSIHKLTKDDMIILEGALLLYSTILPDESGGIIDVPKAKYMRSCIRRGVIGVDKTAN